MIRFVRIIACELCCSTCNPRRKKNINEGKPFEDMEFLEKLGEGGFGTVFRCCDVETKQIVAVKQISILDTYNAVPGSIIREVSFLRELNHPNIVRLLKVRYKKGTRLVHLVLEYLDCDLHDYIIDAERFNSSINNPMTKKVNKVYLRYFVVIFCN